MTAIIIPFPTKEYFVQKCDYDDPLDCTIIKLEAKEKHGAMLEGDQIALHYGWSGWMVFDEDNRMAKIH